LVKSPALPLDNRLVGLWQSTDGGQTTNKLLVLPSSKEEYLVVYPAESPEAMFAHGCLWTNETFTLVQLNWFGTGAGDIPDDTRTFQYARYSVASNTVTLNLLNPDVISKDVASSSDLAKAISANKNNPKLFRNKMVFEKVKK
jgi:hypothetical protein